MVDIEVSEEATNRLHAILSGLGQAEEKVLKPALSRGLQAGRTAFNRQIQAVYYVNSAAITRYSDIGYKKVEMHSDGLVGSIEYAGFQVPLIKFNVTPKKATYGKTSVKSAVKRDETPTELTNNFTAQMPNGHIGIYERKETSRFPIEQKYGPSVPSMAGNAVVIKTVEDRVNEVINKRIEHEIDRILSGNGGK